MEKKCFVAHQTSKTETKEFCTCIMKELDQIPGIVWTDKKEKPGLGSMACYVDEAAAFTVAEYIRMCDDRPIVCTPEHIGPGPPAAFKRP